LSDKLALFSQLSRIGFALCAAQSTAPAFAQTIVQDSAGPDYDLFDSLAEPGVTTTFPGARDSLLGDLGGYRSALARENIGVSIRSSTVIMTGLKDTGQPRSPQLYNGQRFTLQNSGTVANFSWRMDKLNLPDTTLTVGGIAYFSSFDQNAPNNVSLRALSIHQRLFGGKVEVKAGYISNLYEFAGLFTGGSPVLATGLAGLVPIQAGMSGDPVSTPAINMTVNGTRGLYLKVGLQRSVSPRGRPYEVEHNRNGFRFGATGAGALTIAEVGVRRPATKDGHQIWLRAGAFTNSSDYTLFNGGGTASNQVVYGAADLQVAKVDPARPAAGFYVGGSAFWGDPSVNIFTQSYEARTYAIGVLPSRPRDTISLKLTYNKFSPDARSARNRAGIYANKDQTNISLAYSAHVRSGAYFIPAFSYIRHPSFIGNFKDAVLLSSTFYFLF
jgi:carbohydrate-selective porin OprB